jgi:protein-tyrosine phosphatase
MFRILVVCTANICRSPAAQQFLAKALAERQVEVYSAGTRAIDNHFAHPEIERQMLDRGYSEITQHRSSALMPSQLARYGLILCMEQDHLDWIKKTSPTSIGKVKLLGHWDGQAGVIDPINGPEEGYRECLNLMDQYCLQWADKIVQLGLCS